MELIDRDALIAMFDEPERYGYIDINDIRNMPIIDAVEVVRCGECKHRMFDSLFGKDICIGHFRGHQVNSDDYCSYGERREGDNG